MRRNLFAALSGALFGLGLTISGMTNTTKVIGWLDVFGAWDPTLAFVMGGAILPMAIAWRFASRRQRSFLGSEMPGKPSTHIGHDLILGSFLFGAGWGLAGLCPGPAMASITYGGIGGAVFLVAMIAGMVVAPPIRAQIGKFSAT
jgi:uncharacterized membrane protein YedE/YeeE